MTGQSTAPAEINRGNSYDAIPYAVLSHYFTHPDRLATVGTLFGLEPPAIENCRVLELGCASGGNLIPMAYALPGSQFVGIDLSPAQIEQGQKYIDLLKLSNIRLVCQDLLDFSPDQAPFDYILVHGVFSWIPPLAQEKVFEICRQCLSANGVAYVSYNVLPGWKMEQALREMMLFHIRQESQPPERFRKAVELLDFLANDPSTAGDETYRAYLRKTIQRMRKHADGNYQYWIHEYLEEFNTPFYFSEVVEMAGRHALQYLADSDLPTMYTNDLSDESCRFLEDHAHNWVDREQYLDFLRNRMFRRSLFCRQEAALTRHPGLEQLRRLNVVSRLLPIDREISTVDDTPMVFEVTKEAVLTFHDPMQKTALVYLAEQLPRAVPFDELAQATLARLGNAPEKAVRSRRNRPRAVLDPHILPVIDQLQHLDPALYLRGEPAAHRQRGGPAAGGYRQPDHQPDPPARGYGRTQPLPAVVPERRTQPGRAGGYARNCLAGRENSAPLPETRQRPPDCQGNHCQAGRFPVGRFCQAEFAGSLNGLPSLSGGKTYALFKSNHRDHAQTLFLPELSKKPD